MCSHPPAHEDRGGSPVGRCCEKPLWDTSGEFLETSENHTPVEDQALFAPVRPPLVPRGPAVHGPSSPAHRDVPTLRGHPLKRTLSSCRSPENL